MKERPLVKSLAAERSADAALGVLSHFRVQFYDCLCTRADALFELTDAVLCSDGPVTSLVELTLTAEHRRGHGAMYDAVNHGWLEPRRLRRLLASTPLPRAADGRIVLAVDVSNWLRADAPTSPELLFCHVYGRGRSADQFIPGRPYSFVAALKTGRTSWTACPLRDAGPRRSTPRGGQPRKHGGVLTFSKPDSWHTPDQATTRDTTRYGTAEALAWDRMHPRLQARGPWLDHCGELPLLNGTLIRLKVEHLPGDRDPKPVWLWSSRTGMTGQDVDLRWQAFLRRFDLEHTFRLFKQTLGWTVPQVRDPHTADLWTWLIIAAHTQLRLARPLAEDLRRPWERPAEPRRLTPARVRRGFRHLRMKTARPADVPRPSKPGPGRPPGSKNRRPAPRHEPGKTVKRIETLTEHVRQKQQLG